MDDFIILARTRWQLRAAVVALNRCFDHFGFEQHPDKTFIGRVERGGLTGWAISSMKMTASALLPASSITIGVKSVAPPLQRDPRLIGVEDCVSHPGA